MIKKAIYLMTCATLLVLYSGCANGPIRNWCRGAVCNTCQPPVGQPIGCGTNYAPLCDSGVCGNDSIAPGESPAVNGPFMEAPGFTPQATPYYSGSTNSPATNESSYAAPMDSIPGTQVPSAEVYGSGGIRNLITPPSIGLFRGSGTRN